MAPLVILALRDSTAKIKFVQFALMNVSPVQVLNHVIVARITTF